MRRKTLQRYIALERKMPPTHKLRESGVARGMVRYYHVEDAQGALVFETSNIGRLEEFVDRLVRKP